MCHCVQGYCNNNFFVLTCIFLQFYYYFHFFCHTSMLFSSAYTCDLFYFLHFEYMYTVEQCFVRYLCYRTPYFLIPFSRFASVCYVICYHNETCLFKDLRFYFLQTSDNLCALVPFCVAL